MSGIALLLKLLRLQHYLINFIEAGIIDSSLPIEFKMVEQLVGSDNASLFELEQHRIRLQDFHLDKPNISKEKQVVPV
jgi:hypothetical protein